MQQAVNCFLFLTALYSCLNAGIIFGDKNSGIVIDSGSFVVNGNLIVDSGTVEITSGGTLTVEEGATFDISNGTYISEGKEVFEYIADTTLYKDIALSSVKTLSIAAPVDGTTVHTVTISGTGQKIFFADAATAQMIIGDYTAVIFDGVDLAMFNPDAITLGTGSSVALNNATLSLNHDITLMYPISFLSSGEGCFSYLRANGNTILMSSAGEIFVPSANQLIIEDANFQDLRDSQLHALGSATIRLSNCNVDTTSAAPVTFSSGQLAIEGTVNFSGAGSFIYSSPHALVIGQDSSMVLNGIGMGYTGCSFIYGANKAHSKIILNDAALTIGSDSLGTVTITAITVSMNGNSFIQGGGIIAEAWTSLNFGTGDAIANNSQLFIGNGKSTLSDIVLNMNDGNIG